MRIVFRKGRKGSFEEQKCEDQLAESDLAAGSGEYEVDATAEMWKDPVVR